MNSHSEEKDSPEIAKLRKQLQEVTKERDTLRKNNLAQEQDLDNACKISEALLQAIQHQDEQLTELSFSMSDKDNSVGALVVRKIRSIRERSIQSIQQADQLTQENEQLRIELKKRDEEIFILKEALRLKAPSDDKTGNINSLRARQYWKLALSGTIKSPEKAVTNKIETGPMPPRPSLKS